MSEKISEYTPKTAPFASGDLFDVSKLISPGVYETQSFDWDDLIPELGLTDPTTFTNNRVIVSSGGVMVESTMVYDSGSLGIGGSPTLAKLTVIGNSGTQFATAYDANNYMTVTTGTDGATDFIITSLAGTGYKFRFGSKLEITATTSEQIKAIYDSSNYMTVTVSAANVMTFDGNAAASKFLFSKWVDVNGTTGTGSNKIFNVRNNSNHWFYVNEDGNVSSSLGYWIGSNKFIYNHLAAGAYNTYIGVNVGNLTNSSPGNIGIGWNILQSAATAISNICIGNYSGYAITGGDYNLLIGDESGVAIDTGTRNVGIGVNSLHSATSGTRNTAIGDNSLYHLTDRSENTAIGSNSGQNNNGNFNTFIGAYSGTSASQTYTYGIAIGYGAYLTKSRQVVIGNGASKYADRSEEWVFGSAEGMDTVYTQLFKGQDGYGTNVDACSIRWLPGYSTGGGVGGDFIIATTNTSSSGSSLNTSTDRVKIKGGTGNISMLFGGSQAFTHVVASNAGSTTIADNIWGIILEPAALIATYTVTMPANPIDDQIITVAAGSFAITALTLSPNSGQSFATGAAIATLAASAFATYKYKLSNTTRYRVG